MRDSGVGFVMVQKLVAVLARTNERACRRRDHQNYDEKRDPNTTSASLNLKR